MEELYTMGMISSFKGKSEYLSNFYLTKVVYEGVVYESVEHAFQAAKVLIPNNMEETNKQREKFIGITPGQAKRLGRRVKIREDWELVKYTIMLELVTEKFNSNKELREKLLATGREYLQEGNYWHDNYWGVCSCCKCSSKESYNNLGEILMDVRETLRKG